MAEAVWTREKLQKLVDRREPESLHLDYKRSKALLEGKVREDVSKDVAAFANADGGTIIYGIRESTDRLPDAIDDGLAAEEMTAERLEDLILGNISPRPTGLRVHAVELSAGRSGFVVEVPAATGLAPHQAGDRRYYRRYETKNLPMHDHEVRDVMRRATTPAPQIDLQAASVDLGHMRCVRLSAQLINTSRQPLEYGIATVWLGPELQVMDRTGLWADGGSVAEVIGGESARLRRYQQVWNQNVELPVTPELPGDLGFFDLDHDRFRHSYIGWEVRCPGASVRRFGAISWLKGLDIGIHYF